MAVTIDPRTSVFGDRLIVTGTYAAGDNAVDLSSILASIDFAGANSSGIIASRPLVDSATHTTAVVFAPDVRIDGTTIRIAGGLADSTIGDTAPTQAGTFIAIGRRS
jgi:hypothetical protein